MTQSEFRDKVVVVTGAARGLGLGMATRFSQAGAHAVSTDVDAVAGMEAAARLRKKDLAVVFEPLDVRVPEQSAAAVVDRLVETFGRIDIWVNNAGISHLGAAEGLALERWNECIDVMLSGTFYCCQAVGRSMLARGGGVIVNVASCNRNQTDRGTGGLQRAQGRRHRPHRAARHRMGRPRHPRRRRGPSRRRDRCGPSGAEEGHFDIDACVRRTPLRRLDEVGEIAESVLYIASDETSCITGETLRGDGGWVAYQLF